VTGHLVVGSISNNISGMNAVRGFYILDALTGNDLGQLKLTNSSGTAIFAPATSVKYPGYAVGVADDGAIYAADVKTINYAGYLYKIYRWGSETDFVSVAYVSDTGNPLPFRLGDNLRVRGAGTNTQIIAGTGSSYSQVVLFTTTNGSSFTPTVMSVSSIYNGDLWAGIAFGSNNTFYAKGADQYLWQVGFDPVLQTASALAFYPLGAPAGSFGPLGVDLVNGRLIALATSSTAGTTHSVNLFDLNTLSTSSTNYPVDTSYVPTTYASLNRAGSVAFTPDGSMAFVLDTENGIMAYELNVKTTPSTATPARITQIHYGNPVTISGTGPVSHPFALVSSTNVAKAMNLWTPEQTNTDGNGSFTFSVVPGTAKARFFRVITQ
jgi:hypothetical protein